MKIVCRIPTKGSSPSHPYKEGVAGVDMSGKIQKINVSQLRPYFRPQGIVVILLGEMVNINMTLDNDY